jgi:hypothetical protein
MVVQIPRGTTPCRLATLGHRKATVNLRKYLEEKFKMKHQHQKSTPWSPEEFIKIDGHRYVYIVDSHNQITVIQPGRWRRVVKAYKYVNGLRTVNDMALVNDSKPVALSALIHAGRNIEMPKRIRKGDFYG